MSITAAFLVTFLMVILLLPVKAMSQAAAPPPAPAPAPGVPTPPDFPQYIVTPRDDLNPYDLSTMQKSTESGYRQGTGTLGTTPEQSSNIEINEALNKSRQERLKASQKQAAEEEAAEAAVLEAEPSALDQAAGPQSDDLSTPGVRGSLFTWTDENGVLNATNDLGQVPIEYQIQALKNSKGN